VPGAGLSVPLYLLGSSDFSARLAAGLGLPFAFASHFAPEYLQVALEIYRREFNPSAQLTKPYAMLGVGIYAADTDDEARRLFTSAQQQILSLIRGHPGKLPRPVENMDEFWSGAEHAAIAQRAKYTAIGSMSTVRDRLHQILTETAADEVILTGQIHDHAARLRSFEITAQILAEK
jgi:luciferase family oxidoreductase group 1